MICYKDIYDKEKLKFIIDNFDYFYDKIGSFKDTKNNYELITDKKTIFTILNNLFYQDIVKYDYSEKDISKKGRLFGKNSLQGVNKIIRHTLCKNLCIDIDIVNCHNVLLQFYCKKNNIDFSNLSYYNENRDELLLELVNTYSIDRDIAKIIPLSIINGGGQQWFKIQESPPPDWLINFNNEIKSIHKKIAKLEPLRFKKSKIDNSRNPYGTCLNTLLCEMENEVLQNMIEFCNLKDVKISTLCFDGLLIENKLIDLDEMSEYVKYKTDIEVKIVQKHMDKDISLEIPTNFIKSNDIYVNPDIFLCKEKVVIVKAGLGTGKTTATISYINSSKDQFKKILIYTPRITYANSIFNRLNKESIYDDWFLYNDKMSKYKLDKKHLIIQCESLHRVVHNYRDYEDTLIIIDEIESFLTSLTSTKTNKHHESTLHVFEFLLFSKKIICLDAFISDKTLNIFKSLDIPFFYIHYTKKLKQRQFIQIKDDKDVFEAWKKYVVNEISNGKRMYLFFSSLKKLISFKIYIEKNLSHIKYLYYTSEHKENLNDINELWSSVDIIMTTSTITVGVNYDIKNHFHSIGIYANASSKNLVRDIFQSSYRVRHLIDDLMIFALETRHYGINLPTKINEIKYRLDHTIQMIIKNYEEVHKKEHPNTNNFVWLRNLIIDNTYEFNNSIMDMENVFFSYLYECNYIESDIMNDIIPFEIISDEELSDNTFTYADIPSINVDTMKMLKKLPIKTFLQVLTIEKFFFQQSVQSIDNIDDETCLWGIYRAFGRKKFRNLRFEKSIISETLDIGKVVDSTLPIIADKLGIQLSVIKNISSWYNLKHSQDTDTVIPNSLLKKLIPIFKENMKEIYTAFELRDTRSSNSEWSIRKITTITNMVLSKWGYTTIKRRSRRRKGHNGAEDLSEYQLEHDNICKMLNVDVYEKVKTISI
jgi:hypothetical protein